MRQYLESKAEYPDAVLFFRMGDFYEMFFEDAKLASRVLGIALTSRDKERKIPMCGVPFHAVKTYIDRLINEGYKVALCEQLEDPAEVKGIVKRAVTRVITPGTADTDESMDSGTNNFIAAGTFESGRAGFAYMDVSTGEFRITELEGDGEFTDEIRRVGPSELILPESPDGPGAQKGQTRNGGDGGDDTYAYTYIDKTGVPERGITYLDPSEFTHKTARDRLLRHFNVTSLDGFGCEEFKEGVRAAGALLHYVAENRKTDLTHLRKCSPYHTRQYLVMDHPTRRNLEITQNARMAPDIGARSGNDTRKEGTLLKLLDRTLTPMGGRLIASWLLYPLVEVRPISERLDATEELMDERSLRRELTGTLREIRDIERLVVRLAMGSASPRDLVSLKTSLQKIPGLKKDLSGFSTSLLGTAHEKLDPVGELRDLIESSINETPPPHTRDGGFIKHGYSEELDELRDIAAGGKDSIASLEAAEREATGISTLKVAYNRVFGYYIEITKSKIKDVPEHYSRKQTLVNAERFITPELKSLEARILGADEKAKSLELKLFTDVRARAVRYTARAQATSELVALVDTLISFAEVSEELSYVKPVVDEGDSLTIEEGRHPVIEKSSPKDFVPNDTSLDTTGAQVVILTGPNMAGKSTYIRQVALISIMAQVGCFVPAKRAKLGIVDRIFTRVGASDDIARGHSTFMVEMTETANILNNATPKSLLILDEIGRGTSTFDGLSIAWAVAEYIHDFKEVRAKTLFATHYHELTELSLTKERVKNYNMAVKEWNDRVIFLRKVVAGSSSRSYGIEVARLAGLPGEVIARAKEILRNLESGEFTDEGLPRLGKRSGDATKEGEGRATGPGGTRPKQPTLPRLLSHPKDFSHTKVKGKDKDKDPPAEKQVSIDCDLLSEELRKIDTDTLTPLEALNQLNRLKERLRD